MSEKETKKVGSVFIFRFPRQSNHFPLLQSSKATESNDTAIKGVSAYLSLENCETFIEKQTHADRITKLRTDGLAYIRETEFLYSK